MHLIRDFGAHNSCGKAGGKEDRGYPWTTPLQQKVMRLFASAFTSATRTVPSHISLQTGRSQASCQPPSLKTDAFHNPSTNQILHE